MTVSWREQNGERIHNGWYVLGILHGNLILTTQRDRNYYLQLAGGKLMFREVVTSSES